MNDQNDQGSLREAIVKALRKVHDPEIPVNIYDLGLIYGLDISPGEAGARVDVRMTLTAPNCPVADKIPADVERAVRGVEGVSDVGVELVWEPAWSPAMMTEVAQIELEAMGVDPDRAKESFAGGSAGLTVGRKPVSGRDRRRKDHGA
jgi:FeS assembly SUF system protein